MRILGVDPGLDATGYGLIEVGQPHTLVEAGLIRTSSKETLPHRLMTVSRTIREILAQHEPHLLAMEDLYSYYKTPKPAILMAHVRGVILGVAAESEIPVFNYLPTRIKQSVVGKGHANKEQVARLVQVRLGLAEKKVPPDVTDALAVALCHAGTLGKAALTAAVA